jgi:hypothetical protein
MRSRISCSLVLLLIATLALSSDLYAYTYYHGTVTDSALNPIENVIVTPYPSMLASDTTDALGQYSLSSVPYSQLYFIHFYRYEYLDTVINTGELPEQDTINLDVILLPRPNTDAALVDLNRPGLYYPIYEYVWYQPSVIVGNIGLLPQSFDVYYYVYPLDSTRVFFADTLSIENMPPNSRDTLTFADSFLVPLDFAYRLVSYVSLVGDENPLNDTSTVIGTTYKDFYIIFGNKDGSIMPAHNNQLLEVPVWGVTPLGNNLDLVSYMHIPLATSNSIISQRLGGDFPDTLVGLWDDRSFLPPDLDSPFSGCTNQSILGFAYLTPPPDEQNYFNTNGDTVLIATYKMRVTSDTSIIGDTIQPFMIGQNPSNGDLIWGTPDMSVIVPYVRYSPLYIQSLAEWGCHYTPGDINGNGVANGIDVSYAVSYLKGAPHPPVDCNPPCSEQSDPFYAAMDVNGSCYVNGIDITYYVGYLKGGVGLTYCPSCPPAGD